MRALLFFGWLFAFLPLVLAGCLPPEMIPRPQPQHKRSATPFLSPYPDAYGVKVEPWPLIQYGDQRLRVIKYCYADINVKMRYCSLLQGGFALWAHTLGYPAGSETGHNMAFLEAHDSGPSETRQPQYCFSTGPDDREVWNPNVPLDALVIDVDREAGAGAHATLGWTKARGPNHYGRHSLVLVPYAAAPVIAHEV